MNERKFNQSPIVVGNLPADPGVGYNGEIYYNTVSNLFRAYINGVWGSLVSSSGANTSLSNLTTTSINQSLLPNADNTLNLGSSALRWAAAYAVVVSAGASALSLMGSSINANSLQIHNVANPTSAQDAATMNYVDTFAANQTLSNLTSPTAINQDLLPAADITQNLGSSSDRWLELYVQSISNAGGNLVLSSSTDMIDVSSSNIINLANPINPMDAANKLYVDNLVQGLNWKETVRSATTAALPGTYAYNNGAAGVGATITQNGTIAGNALNPQDGVTLAVNDRLLVQNETGGNDPYNGIYVVTQVGDGLTIPYILTRSADADTPANLQWATVQVSADASTQPGYIYRESEDITTIGSDDVEFALVSQGLNWVFSSGLSVSGNVVTVHVDGVTLDITGGGAVEVKAGGISNAQVSATAAIALSKLAALTANRVLFSNPSGVITDNSSTEPNMVVDVLKFGPTPTDYIEKQFVDTITLTNNTSNSPVDASMTFDFTVYAGYMADYYITDGSSPTVVSMGRITLMSNSDGSVSSLVNESADTSDPGVTFTAVTVSSTIVLQYTTTNTSNRTMKVDIKRFLR
jgi:hypothetical protein